MTENGEKSSGSDVTIDVAFWSRLPSWSPEEFEWLLLGLDPEKVDDDDDFDQKPFSRRRKKIRWRFDKFASKGNRHLSPREALSMAAKIRENFPPDLVEAIMAVPSLPPTEEDQPGRTENPRAQEVTALKRRIASLQRIVLVMAVKGYGWKPTGAPPPELIKAISDDFAVLGMSMDASTIRKHLVQAREALEPREELGLSTHFGKT